MELHAAVGERYPALANRFVFVTGGAFSGDARRFLEESVPAVIQKPFSVDDLLALIDTIASGRRQAPEAGGRRRRRSRRCGDLTGMRARKLVVAALVREPGRILMSRRRADQAMPNLWEFPGGKVEPGEHPEAALVREVREELGCDIEVDRIHEVVFHAYPDFDLYMLVYASRITRRSAARDRGRRGGVGRGGAAARAGSAARGLPAGARAGALSAASLSRPLRGRGASYGSRGSSGASAFGAARRRFDRRPRPAPRIRPRGHRVRVAQRLALGVARRLHRVALAGAAQPRLGPGAEVRLQLALGRPVDRRRALLARDLQRLLVLEEVAAVLAAALGRLDHALALLLALAAAPPSLRAAHRPPPRPPPPRPTPPRPSPLRPSSVPGSGSLSSGRTPAASCAALAQVQVPVQLSVLQGSCLSSSSTMSFEQFSQYCG